MSLTPEGFDRFLSALSADRDAAGEQYELIRLKLVIYFEGRLCEMPDDLADETIDRVARRLAEGERIEAPEVLRYVYGVARNVLFEYWKNRRRREAAMSAAPPPEQADDAAKERQQVQLDCFAECLSAQPEAARTLLLQYYEHTGQAKTRSRLETAGQLGTPLNALRIRIHRIKSEVQRCMDRCIARKT